MNRKSVHKNNLCCPVCHDIFTDPAVLSCSHSICKTCLFKTGSAKDSLLCPICGRISSKNNPPTNRALRKVCEAFSWEPDKESFFGHNELCSQHNENLKLFCLTDEEPVCLVCKMSKKHRKHSFCSIDEASYYRKEELNSEIEPLKQKLGDYEGVKQTLTDILEHIKKQTKITEKIIKQEVNMLCEFLRAEEVKRIAVLQEEEKQKCENVKIKIGEISQKICDITDVISAIKRTIQDDDITFLKNFKFSVKRTQGVKQDPEKASYALINVSKHLGNLNFKLWSKMKEIIQFYPVTLNPNTAHGNLFLSENLTSFGFQHNSQDEEHPNKFPANPFTNSPRVLGSSGFDSGTHCWEVEIGDVATWSVGVMNESVLEKSPEEAENGLWELICYGIDCEARAPDAEPESLTFSPPPERIRVQLNYETGIVRLFNPEYSRSLYTFRHKFTERLFPCFSSTLKILPINVSIRIKQNTLPAAEHMPTEPLYGTITEVIDEPIYEEIVLDLQRPRS
ncbi:zinc-binding protein A33-like [Xyrauchen texanus]|uniref:zinc-binding protein A33-like n=1 Tax=Xyrauchen texanus TaxID=154827 RepID=UPI002241B89A|nr:zinc-binding protein A33-like [Xyrauchen texanus]